MLAVVMLDPWWSEYVRKVGRRLAQDAAMAGQRSRATALVWDHGVMRTLTRGETGRRRTGARMPQRQRTTVTSWTGHGSYGRAEQGM